MRRSSEGVRGDPMSIEEQLQRLTGMMEALAGTVVSHRDRLAALIKAVGAPSGRINDRDAAIKALLAAMQHD